MLTRRTEARRRRSDVTDELMTLRELAAYVRRPVATIYGWNSRGGGPPFIKRGRRVLYRQSDVQRWLAAGWTDGRRTLRSGWAGDAA
jgi:predicted DNA-binding transcriptional regulator AlpA